MKINALERPVRLPARIAEALMKEINEGRLRPGDRLPTEQYLAENFDVSRNVVREAVAQLRSAGIVHSRQGIGTVVAPEGQGRPFQLDLNASAGAAVFSHVYELRAAIEMQAAALAARRGSDEQFAAITTTLDHMQEAEEWETKGVDLDIEFHLAVARASGNPFTAQSIDFLTGNMRQTIIATRLRSGAVVGEIKKLTIGEHAAIHDAIVARDSTAARQAMFAHITNAAHRLGYDLWQDTDEGKILDGK